MGEAFPIQLKRLFIFVVNQRYCGSSECPDCLGKPSGYSDKRSDNTDKQWNGAAKRLYGLTD
jgi:hypothetical protein